METQAQPQAAQAPAQPAPAQPMPAQAAPAQPAQAAPASAAPSAPKPPAAGTTQAQGAPPGEPPPEAGGWSALQWALLVGVLLLVVAAVVGGVWWWRKRRKGAPAAEPAARPMSSGRLLEVRQRFLWMQPWRKRTAIVDLPTVVVLGPAGSGKTRMVELDVDWQRQASQFMPSYTDDALLQIYLGPETVVHEVSSTLLEDGSKQARNALWRLWKASFGRRQALVVLVLDVRWLAEVPPDEVRRMAHLLRGKINLVSEACQAPVETRVCMTHMDEQEGFVEFARLLRAHGETLDFELPPAGEEQRLGTSVQALEMYLASGLATQPLEAFERLERFYSSLHKPFASLTRFITALREGGRLSQPLKLSRVYLSSPLREARSLGTFTLQAEVAPARLQSDYRQAHLRRCALLLAVGCLPVLAAYGHFRSLLGDAQEQMARFDGTVKRLQEQGLAVEGPVLEQRGRDAMDAMERLWRSTRYWPPLRSSFTDDLGQLRGQMADIIRDYYLRPLLSQCQVQCEQCSGQVPGCRPASSGTALIQSADTAAQCQPQKLCRPERMLYLLALVHGSRDDDLGRFVLGSLHPRHGQRWAWASALGLRPSHVGSSRDEDQESGWVATLGLAEPVVGDYVVASDTPWFKPHEEAKWTKWPFRWLTLESHLSPWQGHFQRLGAVLADPELRPEDWEKLQQERQHLQQLLADSRTYGSARLVVDLFNASTLDVNEKSLTGIGSTLESLQWLQDNREVLEAVLRMEEEAFMGIQAARKMSWAELLTLSDGLFTPSAGNSRLRVDVLNQPFEFRPLEVSRQLLNKIVKRTEQTATALGGASAGELGRELAVVPVSSRGVFDSEIKPLVDEFSLRMEGSRLSPEESSARKQYVLGKMEAFARRYRSGLFESLRGYQFTARDGLSLRAGLLAQAQPSSRLVDMLRDVSSRAEIGPLDGVYYEPLRNAVAPFKPLVKLMEQDKEGTYAGLAPYLALVSQLQDELAGVSRGAGEKKEPPKADKGEAAGGSPEGLGPSLNEMLSPLGRVSLAMMLEDDTSYLRRVDAWLDQAAVFGEMREPFRRPFLVARELGQDEVERLLAEQWEREWTRTLEPLLSRYPFNAEATAEVEPGELEVLRRKDGAFWGFAERVIAPLSVERGGKWSLRGPLKGRLIVPARMLETLNQLGELSRLLWDAKGKPQSLTLQVLPLPLPSSPVPGGFITMSYLKCGKPTVFSFNQNPTWQDFPINWSEPQAASIGLELRSPELEEKYYRAMEVSRSFWSCFRLLESASISEGRQWTWWLLRGEAGPDGQGVEVRFGVRGEPWVPFRRLSL